MKYLKLIFNNIPKKFKNKKTILLIFVFIIVYIFITRGAADTKLIETSKAHIDKIELEVFAIGKIESINNSSLNFPVSGKVVWVNVQEGDIVKKGQVIASLDKEIFEIALRQAQQSVVAAEAALIQVYDGLPNDDTFQSRVDRTAAEKTKNQAFDDQKLAERNLKNINLVSPINGTVVELNIKVGEEILLTESVARIADVNNLQFTADIDESDIGSIKASQVAIIYLEAFPDEEIKSKVIALGFEGVLTAIEATVFEVNFELASNEKYILGMNGDVQIVTREKDNIIVVPIEALFDENVVWVKKDGNYVQTNVEIGIQNDTYAEIKSGLEIDEEVVISHFDEIGKESLLQKILPF